MIGRALAGLAEHRCAGCGRPGTGMCGACALALADQGGPVPPGLDGLVCAFAYRAGARRLVLELKLAGRRQAARELAAGLAAAVARSGAQGVLTWVPGRPRDVRRRGFDHAQEIALRLAGLTGLPLRGLLRRAGARPDHAGLDRAGRWRDLAGAFRAEPCPAPVVVVDDLVTTGATLAGCAAALRAAGCPAVVGAAACRAPEPRPARRD